MIIARCHYYRHSLLFLSIDLFLDLLEHLTLLLIFPDLFSEYLEISPLSSCNLCHMRNLLGSILAYFLDTDSASPAFGQSLPIKVILLLAQIFLSREECAQGLHVVQVCNSFSLHSVEHGWSVD